MESRLEDLRRRGGRGRRAPHSLITSVERSWEMPDSESVSDDSDGDDGKTRSKGTSCPSFLRSLSIFCLRRLLKDVMLQEFRLVMLRREASSCSGINCVNKTSEVRTTGDGGLEKDVLLGDGEARMVSRVGAFMKSLMTGAFTLPGQTSEVLMGSAGMEVRDELILGIECVLHEAEVADEEVEEIESRDSRRVLVGRCWEGRLGNAIWIGS